MGQPGDPYAAQREQARREAAELFQAPGGGVNGYAHRVWRRVSADLMFLATWRKLGHAEAGAAVCARFGHDQRGRVCERCGVVSPR